MTDQKFWEIIAASRAGLERSENPDAVREEQAARLRPLLAQMPVEEIQAFAGRTKADP
jgi:hypothetical protein